VRLDGSERLIQRRPFLEQNASGELERRCALTCIDWPFEAPKRGEEAVASGDDTDKSGLWTRRSSQTTGSLSTVSIRTAGTSRRHSD